MDKKLQRVMSYEREPLVACNRVMVSLADLEEMVRVNCFDRIFRKLFNDDPMGGIMDLIYAGAIPVYVLKPGEGLRRTHAKKYQPRVTFEEV